MKNNEIISNIFKTLVIILGLIGIFCFNVKNGDLATNFFYYTIPRYCICQYLRKSCELFFSVKMNFFRQFKIKKSLRK